MYPNEVYEIFNVSTLLAISFFFNEKWLTCVALAFFGTEFQQLPHLRVNSLNAYVLKNK